MRSAALVTLALLAAAAPALPAAAEPARRAASDFHRRAVVMGDVRPNGAYAVALSPGAVEALGRGGEVRLFDADGREIPSLVHAAVSRGEVVDRPVTVFNRAFDEDGTQTLSVELTGRAPEAVNEFAFDIADTEYNARVRVEASDDGERWRILRDGLHLIRHTAPREEIDYRHDVLRVPTARFRFYRFTLRPTLPPEPDADELSEPLEIRGVTVREVVHRGASLTVPTAPERYTDDRDPDPRHHYYKLDFGREALGIDRLTFRVPDDEFARAASLWEWSPERGRRTRQLATTLAFRYGDDAHTEFSGFTTDARVLVLMIDQGDDAPVTVNRAIAHRPRQQVRFLGPDAVTPPVALYFEPDEAVAPRYDLARRLRERAVERFVELGLGPVERNPGYAPPAEPRSERVPFLLTAVVVLLVAGLGAYVLRTIQRGVPGSGPPAGA